jgi:NarL family two-component system sensor histidine kinase LiaS
MAHLLARWLPTLRWQLTASHVGVTLLVLVPFQCLTFALVGMFTGASVALTPSMALLAMLGLSLALLLIGGMLMALVFGRLASRPLIRRIQALAGASAAIARGQLEQRIDDQSPDELGQLARQFNRMAEQIAAHVATLTLLGERNAQLAALEERQRLARDLHDSVTQELFSLTMLTAAARMALPHNPAASLARLDELQYSLEHILQETRGIIFALRPDSLERPALADALRDLAATAPARQGLAINLWISDERPLGQVVEHTLLLVAQEALANVIRHSGVRSARVELRFAPDQVALSVEDSGCGFAPGAPPPAGSLGLRSMAERMAGCGGSFAIESCPGHGTRVSVSVPLTAEAEVGGQS